MTNPPPTSPPPVIEDNRIIRPEVLKLPKTVCDQLDQRFEKEDIRQDAHMSGDNFKPKYPAPAALIRRLNEVFGHIWSDEIIRIWNTDDNSQVLVHCRLSIHSIVSGQLITTTKDGIGMCILKHAPNNSGYVNYGYDAKAAHTDALRKAATKFGVSLHLYEGDESHFQGMEQITKPSNNGGQKMAAPFQVERVQAILEGEWGLDRSMWLKSLDLRDPNVITYAEACDLINGSHPFLLWLKNNNYNHTPANQSSGLTTHDD